MPAVFPVFIGMLEEAIAPGNVPLRGTGIGLGKAHSAGIHIGSRVGRIAIGTETQRILARGQHTHMPHLVILRQMRLKFFRRMITVADGIPLLVIPAGAVELSRQAAQPCITVQHQNIVVRLA